MIKAFRIKLKRRDATAGPSASMDFYATEAADIWSEANAQLRNWARTAKPGKTGEEVEYGITFTDGIELRGLVTISRLDNRPDLAAAVRELIQSKSGDVVPKWMPNWVGRLMAITKSGKQRQYTRIRYAYEIGSSRAA